jgi:hypothetical protein
VANLRHGFYLILRPEDRVAGAPDPARWIDPLMKYQGIDYRVSLLRAAAFHGSSHQAAMTFQLIVPKQLRDFEIGRHRLQFVYQAPAAFAQVNQPEWLGCVFRSMWAGDSIRCGHLFLFDVGTDSGVMWAAFVVLP